jgi:crotonobetainyl-CoA:carnitine CoA-transferase CaiB-like acyl-CoA transferase
VVPRLSATPGKIGWLGAGLGEHNGTVFRELLGMDDDEIAELREHRVI